MEGIFRDDWCSADVLAFNAHAMHHHYTKRNQFNQSINQSVNQSIDRPIDRSINQSINPSIDQSINQSPCAYMYDIYIYIILYAYTQSFQANSVEYEHVMNKWTPQTGELPRFTQHVFLFRIVSLVNSWRFISLYRTVNKEPLQGTLPVSIHRLPNLGGALEHLNTFETGMTHATWRFWVRVLQLSLRWDQWQFGRSCGVCFRDLSGL